MEEVRAKFVSMYGARAQTAIAFSLDADFNYILLQLMQHYNNMQGADRLHVIQDKFGQVGAFVYVNVNVNVNVLAWV